MLLFVEYRPSQEFIYRYELVRWLFLLEKYTLLLFVSLLQIRNVASQRLVDGNLRLFEQSEISIYYYYYHYLLAWIHVS